MGAEGEGGCREGGGVSEVVGVERILGRVLGSERTRVGARIVLCMMNQGAEGSGQRFEEGLTASGIA